jgi:hypothetical protein
MRVARIVFILLVLVQNNMCIKNKEIIHSLTLLLVAVLNFKIDLHQTRHT